MRNDISMLIITKDRQYALLPIVQYHTQADLPIYIADGSEKAFTQAPLFERIPQVQYFHLPHEGFHERASTLLQKIETPYCVFRADRRHQCNNAIAQCLAFLKENPDYSSASGFWAFDKNFHLYYSNNALAKPWVFDDPTERVQCHALSFEAPFYNVHKTELAQLRFHIIADLKKLTQHIYFIEYIDYFSMFFLGKTRHLSIFGGIVQDLQPSQSYTSDFFSTHDLFSNTELVNATYTIIEKHLLPLGIHKSLLHEAFFQYLECLKIRFMLHGFVKKEATHESIMGFEHAEEILRMIYEKNPQNTPFLMQALQALLAFMTDNTMYLTHVMHAFSEKDHEATTEIGTLMDAIESMESLYHKRAIKSTR